ncbi:hydroxyacid dehydrogenase [Roseomonas sp. PWR1]|uniref:Hydroxyacid dehydrogenase n=1 Tax=Roseomonas nitratireducens TaxID=2820810 RepID=A0ABS4ATP9_9PROT|nr:NAD(P)-dependent oxidoreductase [Neoroseomonas nitratireducens]MBP0464739.1 hydroxyacid dehydrogenase [Neoroseomonas nitratireducens]
MTRPLILATARIFPQTRDALAPLGEVVANEAIEPWPEEERRARAARADALLAFMTDRVDEGFLAAAPRLRIVACALKGADNFDLDACRARGVAVSLVPDLLTAPTAELAIGLAIGLGRHLRDGDAAVRGGGFSGWRPVLYGQGLDGATVAVLGLGALGGAICARLQPFGCRVLGVDPSRPAPPGVEATALEDALARADLVIAALPLLPGTLHLVDAARLALLRPGALLVNVGRGSTVSEAAVADALAAGRLGGYGADVFELEDWAIEARPRAIEPRLLAHPRTLFTPHLGSAVEQVRRAIELRAAANIADMLEGCPPRDRVA